MAEQKHEHGSMDMAEHERTFAGFLRVCAIVLLLSLLTLIVLAIFRT